MSDKSPLEKYIDKHSKLIAAIGVFAALTAFFVRENVPYIACVTLLISAMLTWELLVSFKEKIEFPIKTSLRLIVFKMLLILLFVTIGVYFFILLIETNYLKFFVVLGGYGLLAILNSKIIIKYKLFESDSAKFSTKIIGIVLIVLVDFLVTFVMLKSEDFLSLLAKLFS